MQGKKTVIPGQQIYEYDPSGVLVFSVLQRLLPKSRKPASRTGDLGAHRARGDDTPALRGENFYIIVGASVFALIGLSFVVITLIADMPIAGRPERPFAAPMSFVNCAREEEELPR